MPVINFTYDELFKQLGCTLDKKELIDILPMISSDVESYDEEEVKGLYYKRFDSLLELKNIIEN